MKKPIFILFIFLFTWQVAFGQTLHFFYGLDISANGTREFIIYDSPKKTFSYFSALSTQGVNLQVLFHSIKNGLFQVVFPNSSAIYDLTLKISSNQNESSSLTCKNPDGSIREFMYPLYTNCYQAGRGNAYESIYLIGFPEFQFYFSAKYPNGVMLKGEMNTMSGIYEISFPDSSKVYELHENTLQCKNPDGSIQTFRPAK